MTITIKRVTGTELYQRYPGQTDPQDCFVELDARTGALEACVNGEIGNAIPFDVHHGHRLRWSIQALRADAANALLETIAPLAARVVGGYSSRWDGSNTVASFDADAAAAWEAIESLCARVDDENNALVVWQASEWFGGMGTRDVQARDLGITAATTDQELDAIGAREAADPARREDVDEIEGLDAYLRELREVARAAASAAA